MGYIKTDWVSELGTKLNRFTKINENGSTVELVRNPETITRAGTVFSTDAMNNMQKGIVYDYCIDSQQAFDDLIADSTWFGAKNILWSAQVTKTGDGIIIPATVEKIHAINGGSFTLTDATSYGIQYATRPTELKYEITGLEVSVTGATNSLGSFVRCTNLINCIGEAESTAGGVCHGFYLCVSLTNCKGTGTNNGSAYGYRQCTSLTNCTGTGTGSSGYGFSNCTSLTDCTGAGTGTGTLNTGYGFYN
jgi:hypothetical protein